MQAGSGEVRGRGVNAKESEELMGNNAARFAPEAQGGVDVSVVIPCLNKANSVGICVSKAMEAFRATGLRGEVVVADNGSTDGSIEIAEKMGARVVRVEQRGYGSALRAGLPRRAARSSSWATRTT